MTGRIVMAVSVALVLGVGLGACGGSLNKKTLTFNEKDTNNFGFTDNPPKAKVGPQGPDMVTDGDTLSFSNDMVDTSAKDVGDLDGTCTATRKGRFDQANLTCQATVTLPKGRLFLAVGGKGSLGAGTTSGAVTGGTGDYAGASGTFTSVGESNSKDTFKLFIPK